MTDMTSAQKLERALVNAGFSVVDKRSKRNRKTPTVDQSAETPALPAIVPDPQADTLALPAIAAAPQGNEVVSPAEELARLRANGEVLNARLAKAKVDLAKLQKLIEITTMELIINNSKVTTALQELELHKLQTKPVEPSVPASAPTPAKSFLSLASELSSNESLKSTFGAPKQSTQKPSGMTLERMTLDQIVAQMRENGGRVNKENPHLTTYSMTIAAEQMSDEEITNMSDRKSGFICALSQMQVPQKTLSDKCKSLAWNYFPGHYVTLKVTRCSNSFVITLKTEVN
jgi:hypothetical protein